VSRPALQFQGRYKLLQRTVGRGRERIRDPSNLCAGSCRDPRPEFFSLSNPQVCIIAQKASRGGYTLRSMSESPERDALLALMVRTPDEPGVLHALTSVFLEHRANITHVDIAERHVDSSTVYFELEDVSAPDALIGDLESLPIVRAVERAPSFQKVYGKRIIIMGGGAQVGQVAIGAISEADRHNIRGEKISVDTIPLVGEEELAAATRAVARLPRAVALVLAGALMGGEIARAVYEIREKGIIVLSLNMPGSVPDAADLVVSDPVQCGVMAVMAVSESARFDIRRQRGRRY
jgi:energy-converting hydrogenase B subunit Q